ncbi:MAG: hypothetical protein ACQKBT_08375 [Puniceicoccales bacterium]
MKALSLILRIVTLAVIIALGTMWFLNKDELSAINEAYQNAGQQLNIPDQPLSKVITKGMNDLSQTQSELRETQARAASVDQRLASTNEELTATEDQLRATNQKLRNTQRDFEALQNEVTDSSKIAERLTAELKTVRSDLIRVNREKFELSQQIETVEEEKRALARRVELLGDGSGSTVTASAEGEEAVDSSAEVARLKEQLDAARSEIARLSNNPLGAALAASSGGDDTLAPNQVRVKSINLERGLIVLSPSSSDEFVGVSTLTVNRDGSPIANLKLRGVYPDYIVAEILPDSVFADALQSGSVYTYRK